MIIWLASYPKSGNTWLRFFILSLLIGNKIKMNLNHLNTIVPFPKKSQFDGLVKNALNIKEVAEKWLISQNKINSDNQIRFMKTHNMLARYKNNVFTDSKNTLATIYIVRDPRNVITSVKNHFSIDTYEEAKKFLFNETQITTLSKIEEGKFIGKTDYPLPQIIGSWQTHYRSWKNMKKNFLLVKYEKLVENPIKEFEKIRNFLENILKTKFTDIEFNKAIKDSAFDKLKSMEETHGFTESSYNKKTHKKNKFFYLGPDNNWKKILDKKISRDITKKFELEMQELGYL